jgi:hypothetical protein
LKPVLVKSFWSIFPKARFGVGFVFAKATPTAWAELRGLLLVLASWRGEELELTMAIMAGGEVTHHVHGPSKSYANGLGVVAGDAVGRLLLLSRLDGSRIVIDEL